MLSSTVILTYERTGSNWLCDSLNSDTVYCAGEIFCDNPLVSFWQYKFLLEKLCVSSPIIKTFANIFHQNNFHINPDQIELLKNHIKNKHPYSLEFFDAFRDFVYKLNMSLVFKIFRSNLTEQITINEIIDRSDYIIVNYRKDLLATYISYKKAINYDDWSMTNNRLKQNPDYYNRNIQIIWNESEYLDFCKQTMESLDLWQQQIGKKQSIVISYEDIHNCDDKSIRLSKMINSLGLDICINQNPLYLKQSSYTSIENNIENITDYKKSMNSIPKYINYENQIFSIQ